MFTKTVLTASVIAFIGVSLPSQTLANTRTPAELPPASYTGSQYVDSRGCVFVRAGAAGNVTWIPRMDRARSHICNARPTAVARAPEAVATGATVAASAATATGLFRGQQTAATAPIRRAAPVAATMPVTTGVQLPATNSGVRYINIPSTSIRATAPTRTATPVRTPAVTQQTASSCPGASPLSRQYINQGQHGPVRCGPQPVHPMDVHRPHGAAPTSTRSSGAISYAFGARPPFEPVNAAPQTPSGYRVAWDDGRLNPNRGPGGTQLAASTTSRLSAATVSTRNAPATTRASTATRPAATQNGRVAVSVGVGHRFVQVGTYRNADSVQRAVRILQRLGLPAARSPFTRGGQSYEVVLAGPFSDAQSLGNALYRARQAGFSDAITRK